MCAWGLHKWGEGAQTRLAGSQLPPAPTKFNSWCTLSSLVADGMLPILQTKACSLSWNEPSADHLPKYRPTYQLDPIMVGLIRTISKQPGIQKDSGWPSKEITIRETWWNGIAVKCMAQWPLWPSHGACP